MAFKETGKVFDGLKAGYMRYGILLILFFATVMNYMDRTVFNVLAPFIRTDMGWSHSDLATALNAFKWGGVIGLFIAGPIIDRIGARWGFTIAVIFWTIGGAATGAAIGMTMFIVTRFILGLGESANWPAATKAISEWFPSKERGVATGFFNGGVAVGSILAAPTVFILIGATAWLVGGSYTAVEKAGEKTIQAMNPSWMWRMPFAMVLVVGAVWLYFWLRYYYPLHSHPRVSKEEVDLIEADRIVSKKKKAAFSVLRKPTFWGLFISRGLTSTIWFFVTDWLYTYLSDEYNVTLAAMAFIAPIPFLFNDVANILGGYISGKLIANGWNSIRARITLMGIGAVLMGTCFTAVWATHWVVAVLIITLLLFFWGLWVSNMLALVTDSFPTHEVASVMSWTGIAQYSGAILFTIFTGRAVDIARGVQVAAPQAAAEPTQYNWFINFFRIIWSPVTSFFGWVGDIFTSLFDAYIHFAINFGQSLGLTMTGYSVVFMTAATLPVLGFLFTLWLNRPSMVKRANG